MAYTTINKSTDYFNTKLFVGNSSTNAITAVGHQPDLTWIKRRDGGNGYSNFLFDAVRGVNKGISSNQTAAEQTFTSGFNSFNSDGFTLGANSSGGGATELNYSGGNYASWNWKAGGGQGSSNTAGSINTTYTSVNTTAGFSISSYTGTGATATIGHGLGAVPKMMIIKQTSSNGGTEDWLVYHQSMGNTHAMNLNLTNAASSSVNYWQNTTPSSSVFYVGANDKVNNNTVSYIAYCFAEKTGYSKFGQYTGNGNGNGAFVYTGFKPSFVIIKRTDTADVWTLWDNKRLGYNPNNSVFEADSSNAEASSDRLEIISNGFKLRYNWTPINSSGGTYVYMAFGQSIVGSNNIPNNAR